MFIRSRKMLAIVMTVIIAVSFMPVLGSTIAEAATKGRLAKKKITLFVGKTYKQKLIVKGKTVKAKKVKWKSKKPSVAKIDKKGKIKAVKKGTAAMTAKYKKRTYKFKVIVKKKAVKPTPKRTPDQKTPSENASDVKDYILKNGHPINSDYFSTAYGDKCIEADTKWDVDDKGHTVKDVYLIAAYNNNDCLSFCHYRKYYDGSEVSHQGYNTEERTWILYNPNDAKSFVSFNQLYYYYMRLTGQGSWHNYQNTGTLNRSIYAGTGYYGTEVGIENITIGGDNRPITDAYDGRLLVEWVQKTIISTDILLKEKLSLGVRNLGFKQL